MSGAELAARVTAAKATLSDFQRKADAYLDQGAAPPDWSAWAWQLSYALAHLLAEMDTAGGGDRC